MNLNNHRIYISMEAKLNKKINAYLTNFNDKLVLHFKEKLKTNNQIDLNELELYLTNNNKFEFEKSDFYKKARSKNIIQDNERCLAMRANETQCTRRKKENSCFCGTHIKGAPYGTVPDAKSCILTNQKLVVFNQDINGVNCFIDNNGNIYKTEDIMNQSKNPSIIGSYDKNLITAT